MKKFSVRIALVNLGTHILCNRFELGVARGALQRFQRGVGEFFGPAICRLRSFINQNSGRRILSVRPVSCSSVTIETPSEADARSAHSFWFKILGHADLRSFKKSFQLSSNNAFCSAARSSLTG